MYDYLPGQPAKFIVNTQNAGSGALAVTVDGPSKAQLTCKEVDDGYEFTYMPTAPGDYFIIIKYAGSAHIPGSPFKATIVGMYKKLENLSKLQFFIWTLHNSILKL